MYAVVYAVTVRTFDLHNYSSALRWIQCGEGQLAIDLGKHSLAGSLNSLEPKNVSIATRRSLHSKRTGLDASNQRVSWGTESSGAIVIVDPVSKGDTVRQYDA